MTGPFHTLTEPPDNCPNGAVCIEDEIQRRRATDRNEWVRWAVGLLLSILSICTGWLVGRINTHQDKIVQHDSEITNLKAVDAEIKSNEKDRKDEYLRRLERIEEKVDKLNTRWR